MNNVICSAGKVGQVSYLLIKTDPSYVESSIYTDDKLISLMHADMVNAKNWTEEQIRKLTSKSY